MNERHTVTDVDIIADALDSDEPARALDLAVRALQASEEADPILHYFAGRALLDLGRADAAVPHLERAVEFDSGDPDYRADLAHALLRTRRYDEAHTMLTPALRDAPDVPDLHELAGLLAERGGRFDEADASFAEASRLDPERFPAPVRLDPDAFAEVATRASDRLPERFRSVLAEVAVTIEDVPSDDILEEGGDDMDASDLLGLFVGVSLAERSHLDPGSLPPRILLFRRNLERYALDPADLEEQIAVTLYHELGHYLGLDEDELEAIDLA